MQHLLPTMPSDIFYSNSFLKMPMDTFNYLWDALCWFCRSISHESWLEKHSRSSFWDGQAWNAMERSALSAALGLTGLLPSDIYLFSFEGRLVFLGLFSFKLHCSPLLFSLFIVKNGEVTHLKEAPSSWLEWEGAQVTRHVAQAAFSLAVSVLTFPPVPVVVHSSLGHLLPTPSVFPMCLPLCSLISSGDVVVLGRVYKSRVWFGAFCSWSSQL